MASNDVASKYLADPTLYLYKYRSVFDIFFSNAVDIYVHWVKFVFWVYKSAPFTHNYPTNKLYNTNLADTGKICIRCFDVYRNEIRFYPLSVSFLSSSSPIIFTPSTRAFSYFDPGASPSTR